jgi:hypothetical protein
MSEELPPPADQDASTPGGPRLSDGTVDTYQGTYFVHHGVISRFNVHQIG